MVSGNSANKDQNTTLDKILESKRLQKIECIQKHFAEVMHAMYILYNVKCTYCMCPITYTLCYILFVMYVLYNFTMFNVHCTHKKYRICTILYVQNSRVLNIKTLYCVHCDMTKSYYIYLDFSVDDTNNLA